MADDKKKTKTAFDYSDEAEREVSVCVLRSAKAERDWGTGWMASARQFQDMLVDALEGFEAAQADNRRLLAKVMELQRELAARDQSFRTPPVGLA